MPETTYAARHGRRAHKPAAARRSVLVYLVALVIVPALGMPLFAMPFSFERLEDASSARRIANGMEQVVVLEDVRSGLRDEALEAAIRTIAAGYDLTVESVQDRLGNYPVRTLAETRADTDAAIGAARQGDSGSPELADLESALRQARSVVDQAIETPSPDPDVVWTVYLRYDDVYELISAAQDESVRGIVVGRFGDGSREVLSAVSELTAVRELGEALFSQMSALQGIATTPTIDEQRELLYKIESDRRSSTVQAGMLEDHVSEAALAEWERFLGSSEFVLFDRFLGDLINGRANVVDEPDGRISVYTDGFIQAGSSVVPVSEEVGDLIGASVDRGVAAAELDADQAEARARIAVLTTGVLLVVTCAGLVLVGGTMRRDLLHLAAAAGRLRSGRLESVPVEGPREIALVAEALNEAVANLGQVSSQAEILASGRLDHPALREPVQGELGSAVHASVGRLVDSVHELERLREELAHQASHDRLTGLPNRAEGERLLTQALDRARRSGRQAGVLFVDLDDFKHINDTLGHAAGDAVLVATAERMLSAVRPGDTVCRLGGDEFVIILEAGVGEVTVAEATAVADRIVAAVAEPIQFHSLTIVTDASIGIALSAGATDPAVVRGHADVAMYRAKASEGDGVEVYDEDLDGSGLPRRPKKNRGPGTADERSSDRLPRRVS